MSQTQYISIFSVTVSHTYFPDSICNCLLFSPDSKTGNTLDRYGFKMNVRQNGFDLYMSSSQPLEDLLNYITNSTSETAFNFTFQTSDPSFSIFTNLPVNFHGEIEFDSNSYEENNQGQLKLNMSTTEVSSPSTLGNLSIQFADLISQANVGKSPAYLMEFTSRSTQWQYYIINSSNLEIETPGIESKSDLTFSGPTDITLPNNQSALLFTSEELIPMRQVPDTQFNLVNTSTSTNNSLKSGSTTTTLFKGLPNASPEKFNIIEIDGKSVISSPMYIYI